MNPDRLGSAYPLVVTLGGGVDVSYGATLWDYYAAHALAGGQSPGAAARAADDLLALRKQRADAVTSQEDASQSGCVCGFADERVCPVHKGVE